MRSLFHELSVGLFFDGKGFDRLGAGNAFVKVTCDVRIDLPYLVMQIKQPSLEESEEHHNDRYHEEYQPREFHVYSKHYNSCAQYEQCEVRSIEKLPGEEFSDPGSIAHYPGVDVSHTVLIIVIKAQFLEM